MIDGKQMTITWHVDNLKISHVSEEVVDTFIDWLRDKCRDEEINKVKATKGDKHDHLGMTLDHSKPDEVTVDMRHHAKKMMEEFPEELKTDVKTPTSEQLFQVEETTPLSKEQAETFHTFMAKSLFLGKRARPDIQPAVACLCT